MERLEVVEQVSLRIDVAAGLQALLLRPQKAVHNGSKGLQCAFSPLGLLAGGVLAEADLCVERDCLGARGGNIDRCCCAECDSAVLTAELVLVNPPASSTGAEAKPEAGDIIIEVDGLGPPLGKLGAATVLAVSFMLGRPWEDLKGHTMHHGAPNVKCVSQ